MILTNHSNLIAPIFYCKNDTFTSTVKIMMAIWLALVQFYIRLISDSPSFLFHLHSKLYARPLHLQLRNITMLLRNKKVQYKVAVKTHICLARQ